MSQSAEKTIEDYRELAEAYREKHNCRWSEACLAIKRRYPESRAAFGAPSICQPEGKHRT